MGDLFKGLLGGGWSILVGWIVPSALNVLALVFVVLPPVHGKGLFSGHSLLSGHSRREDVAVLGASAVAGLLLAAVQTGLYRILEGCVGWRPDGGGRRPNPWAALTRLGKKDAVRRGMMARRQTKPKKRSCQVAPPCG